ncbi:MAG TPA: cyclic nucleotide-binding domain-containing protein [Verrucomicrobiota bacterium]|nr:cyclic nucleotide-binding domain-containing protein [Verrucomicrobiota bacterium]
MNLDTLKGIALLKAMDDEALGRLAAVLEPRSFAARQAVFQEGDPGDGMYFIVSGAVRIEKCTGTGAGAVKTLAVLEPGDYFGEMALFDQQPRSASAVAAGATETLRLSTASFGELHGSAGHAGLSVLFAMIRTAGDRIRRLNAQVVVYDEIGKAIGESKTLDQLLEVVLRQLGQATLADWGLVVLRSQFSERLELRGTLNLALAPAQKDDVALGRGFLAPALRENEGRLLRDFEADEPFKSCARLGFESATMLLMPVAVQDQVLGLIVLGAREADQFDLNDLNLARGVARQAAQAIVNARHREEEQARALHGRQFVRF